jgi:hypothetical protein
MSDADRQSTYCPEDDQPCDGTCGVTETGECGRVREPTIGGWCQTYRAAFVTTVLARGWTRDDADAWASEIDEEAWRWATERDPVKCAANDVLECEVEAASV